MIACLVVSSRGSSNFSKSAGSAMPFGVGEVGPHHQAAGVATEAFRRSRGCRPPDRGRLGRTAEKLRSGARRACRRSRVRCGPCPGSCPCARACAEPNWRHARRPAPGGWRSDRTGCRRSAPRCVSTIGRSPYTFIHCHADMCHADGSGSCPQAGEMASKYQNGMMCSATVAPASLSRAQIGSKYGSPGERP